MLHAKALPGNPYDRHPLAVIIPEVEASVGASLTKIVAYAGYRGRRKKRSRFVLRARNAVCPPPSSAPSGVGQPSNP